MGAKRVRCKKTAKIYSRTDAFHPAKLRINVLYAKSVREFVGLRARHLILDSRYCVTSRTLHKEGFCKDAICAPNICEKDSEALQKFGINSPLQAIEECNFPADALWYDGMLTPGGNITEKHYLGPVVDRFLLQKREKGERCLLALTIFTRARETRALRGSVERTVLNQIARLTELRGYNIVRKTVEDYKRNLLYMEWRLVRSKKGKSALLTWTNSSQYIGFPPGYVM